MPVGICGHYGLAGSAIAGTYLAAQGMCSAQMQSTTDDAAPWLL